MSDLTGLVPGAIYSSEIHLWRLKLSRAWLGSDQEGGSDASTRSRPSLSDGACREYRRAHPLLRDADRRRGRGRPSQGRPARSRDFPDPRVHPAADPGGRERSFGPHGREPGPARRERPPRAHERPQGMESRDQGRPVRCQRGARGEREVAHAHVHGRAGEGPPTGDLQIRAGGRVRGPGTQGRADARRHRGGASRHRPR